MNIILVPKVCAQLVDQSNCARAIEACGANTNPDVCTAKLIGRAITDPEPMVVVKSLYGFGKDSYHVVMKSSHSYLHHFAKDLVQNIGGDGKIGAVGNFISSALGVQ